MPDCSNISHKVAVLQHDYTRIGFEDWKLCSMVAVLQRAWSDVMLIHEMVDELQPSHSSNTFIPLHCTPELHRYIKLQFM